MSNVNQWLQDLSLIPDFNATQWQSMKLISENRQLNEGELAKALESMGTVSGWHQETGRVNQTQQAKVVLQNRLLAAEWFNENESIQVNYIGNNQWHWRVIRLEPSSADTANCLAQPVSHLRANGKGKLHYLRLWQADANLAPSIAASVLTAIDEDRS